MKLLLLGGRLPVIACALELAGVMPHGFLLGNPVTGSELIFTHPGSVVAETIHLRDVPLQETLQEEMIYEDRRIRLDAIQETLVPLVSPKLAVAEIVTGHQDRIQVHRLPQDIHPGMERNLPLAVHHGRRNTDPELDIHLSAPLCLVTETGGYDGGIQHVRCYHLPRCLIFHRLEENKVASVFAFDKDGVGMLETNTGNLVR